ncbi:MAG: hypothetical protein ABFC84_16025 [Veillonellales bacterium]
MERDNCIFVPPATIPSSPYKKGKIVRLPELEVRKGITVADISTTFVPPSEFNSPFKSMVEYEEQTGMRLIRLLPKRQTKTMPKQIGSISIKSSDKFIRQSNGLWCDVQGKPRRICNFYINIREIIVHKKYYGSERNFISFDIITQSGNLEEDEMPLAEYKKMLYKLTNDYPQLFVNPQFNNAANYFLEYSSMIYAEALDTMKKKVVYDYHGWENVDGKTVYLSKALPYCNAEAYVPRVDPNRASQIYMTGQSFLAIGKQVLSDDGSVNLLATLKQILPIFLYAHAGYTAKVFKDAGADLQFVLAIIGQTGSFKTSVSKTIFEVFNTKPMLNFQSTPRAIELYRDSCRDMIMLLDDIFSCKDKESMEKFERILRCFGDGVAKAKSDITSNKIEQFDVRGGCVITAENDLARQQSSHLRFLTVHVDNHSFSGEELKKWQMDELFSKRNCTWSKLQEYFSLYIQYLSTNYDAVVDRIMHFEPPILELEFPRLQTNYKCMAALARLVLDCGIHSSALSAQEAERLYHQWILVIQEVILENQRESKVSAPYKLYSYAVNQGLGTGMLVLAANKNLYASDNSNMYGGFINSKNATYVLNPDKCFEFVEKFYQKKGGSFQASDTAVYRELLENGISLGYNEAYKTKTGETATRQRYLKKVQINGIQTTMLIVKISNFNQLVNNL